MVDDVLAVEVVLAVDDVEAVEAMNLIKSNVDFNISYEIYSTQSDIGKCLKRKRSLSIFEISLTNVETQRSLSV